MVRNGPQRHKKTKHIYTLYADQGRGNGIPYSSTLRSNLTLLHAGTITELPIMFLTVAVKLTI